MEDFNFDQIFEKMSSLTVEMARENARSALTKESKELVAINDQNDSKPLKNAVNNDKESAKKNVKAASNEKSWFSIFLDFAVAVVIAILAYAIYTEGKEYTTFRWHKSQMLDSGSKYEEEYYVEDGVLKSMNKYSGGNLIETKKFN